MIQSAQTRDSQMKAARKTAVMDSAAMVQNPLSSGFYPGLCLLIVVE
jgi:hypothetical protein